MERMSELARKAALMTGKDQALIRNTDGTLRIIPADDVPKDRLPEVAEYRSGL